jgi:hypothetical protein
MATLWNALKPRRYDGLVAMPHERTADNQSGRSRHLVLPGRRNCQRPDAVPGKQWDAGPMRPLEKWCRLQREIFRAQLGRLEGRLPNPFNDYHEPLLFADMPGAKEKLREWIAAIDELLGE